MPKSGRRRELFIIPTKTFFYKAGDGDGVDEKLTNW